MFLMRAKERTSPSELKLSLAPHRRFDAIDVTACIAETSDLLKRHQQMLFCSLHTTAGYLDRSLALRMNNSHDLLSRFFHAFRALFPEGAEYSHDQVDRRTELSEEQKTVEPRNGDSHLTFIGAGMKNCVVHRTETQTPVYFIDLDGATEVFRRERKTTVIGFDRERRVADMSARVPVSKHPMDSINLADPRLGLLQSVDERLRKLGVEYARVDLMIDSAERNAGLTVNEYETLLVKHDLVEVLQNPLRFARIKGRNMIADPLSIPAKTLSYAQYDAVRILNSLMEALRIDQSSFERLIAKMLSLPARCFFRSRRVSFLASCDGGNVSRVVRGTYQSPILVQWQSAEKQTRHIDISIVELS
jgi:thiamine phosphate synthase YjbQ (UPF0047 family)